MSAEPNKDIPEKPKPSKGSGVFPLDCLVNRRGSCGLVSFYHAPG